MSLRFNSILRNAYKHYNLLALGDCTAEDLTFVSVNASLSARLGCLGSVLKDKRRYYNKRALDQLADALFMPRRDLYSKRCSAIVLSRNELSDLQNSYGKRNVSLQFKLNSLGVLEIM